MIAIPLTEMSMEELSKRMERLVKISVIINSKIAWMTQQKVNSGMVYFITFILKDRYALPWQASSSTQWNIMEQTHTTMSRANQSNISRINIFCMITLSKYPYRFNKCSLLLCLLPLLLFTTFSFHSILPILIGRFDLFAVAWWVMFGRSLG